VWDWYDYGARFYDPQIGRWHSVDPLTESSSFQTPYNFCSNNPILRIDLYGLQDSVPIPIQEVVCGGKRKYPIVYDLGWSPSGGNSNQTARPPVTPYVSAKDNAKLESDELAIHMAESLHKLTSAKLGMLSAVSYRIYGETFYGNQNVKILKLGKTLFVAGLAIDFVIVYESSMKVYDDPNVDNITNLVLDIVKAGAFAYSPELGVICGVSSIVINDPQTQNILNEIRVQKAHERGEWVLPMGPLYIGPKN
jgi:hypothetical protein